MLKADLHVHTEYSPDCLNSLKKITAACRRHGIDCIAVTDHNEIKGALLLREMAPFRVIVGEEIRTECGEIIGYFLNRRIKPGLSPARTVAEIRDQGGLVCIPHPFDRLRKSRLDLKALQEIEKSVDIIEVFNSRNIYGADNKKAEEYAMDRGLLVSVGSDAHWPWEIGGTYMQIPEFDGAEGFRASLQSVSPVFTGTLRQSGLLVHAGTKALKIIKKTLFFQALPVV